MKAQLVDIFKLIKNTGKPRFEPFFWYRKTRFKSKQFELRFTCILNLEVKQAQFQVKIIKEK